MADAQKRVPENTPGRCYVDWTCLYCGLCVEIAPNLFAEEATEGWAYILRQPQNEREFALIRDAAEQCPLDCIGLDDVDQSALA